VSQSRSMIHVVFLGLLASAVAMPQIASAQTAQICLSGQNRYAGTAARGAIRCHVKAMRKGLAVDPACISEREAWMTSRYTSIENDSLCLTEPAAAAVWASIDPMVSNFAAALPLTGGRCAFRKLAALGSEFKQLLNCYAKAAEGSEAMVDPACILKAQTRLDTVFIRFEDRFTCMTTGDAATLSSDATTVADTVGSYLRGMGTTTTSTTTTSTSMMLDDCPVNGAVDGCAAYRDNPACKACVDATVGPNAGVATAICTGAGPTCDSVSSNIGCSFSINTATTCGPVCCP
jgi:hypothetical protein